MLLEMSFFFFRIVDGAASFVSYPLCLWRIENGNRFVSFRGMWTNRTRYVSCECLSVVAEFCFNF